MRISLHELYIRLVPPAAGFRVPARIAILAALGWATLSGLGVEALLALLATQAAGARVLVASAAIALQWMSLFLPSQSEKFRFPKDTAPLLLEWEEDRGLREGRTLDGRLFRLTTADNDIMVAERQRSAELALARQYGGDGNGAWLRWMRWLENDNVLVWLPSLEGYEEGLAPIVRTKDFFFHTNRNLRQARPDLQLLGLLGVSRIFSDLPVDQSLYPRIGPESRGPRTIYAVPGNHAAAFWMARAEGIDFAALEGPFARGGAPHSERQVDAVAYGEAPRWDDPMPALSTDVTDPNRVVVRSADGAPGDAVLAMAWYPGWVADGRRVEWLGAVHARIPRKAFHDGVATLEFRPASHRVGLFLSTAGLALWMALLGCRPRRRAPVMEPGSPATVPA